MKVIYNKLIPPSGFAAINLFGLLFARKGVILTDRLINHERIHTAQMKEMLYVFFYIWYLIEWFVRLFKYKKWEEAYYNVSFEKEAYGNDDDLEYLTSMRKKYTWIKYILK